ncbi:hypothetical protein EGC86_20780 [Shewanella frigidimarina]|uniref:hypothetical protein n=1 Tax=Shewanella frigidimarina TaxID=56812 RepID=UPI000F4FC3E0|nr:hypothetical protein [Shewanella frigidimarina]RPA57240.1 hypothetical protein EGC86_20780 [Shewanella frigidimarina]
MAIYNYLIDPIGKYSIEDHLVQGTVDWDWVNDWAKSHNLPLQLITSIKSVSNENGTSPEFAKNIGDFLYVEFIYDKNTSEQQIKYFFDIIFVKKRLEPNQINFLFSEFLNKNVDEWEKEVHKMVNINHF